MKAVPRPLATARQRLLVIAGAFSLCMIMIMVSLVHASLWHDPTARDTRALSERRAANTDPATAPLRAEIRDRNGNLMATTLRMASVFADPKSILDAQEAAEKLLPFMPKETKYSLIRKLTAKSRFVWLRRNVTPKEQYDINRLGIPGIDFQFEERRIYPAENLGAHIIGYTDRDGTGIAGLEKTFNAELRDHEEPLFLSIDNRVQHVVRRETLAAMERFSGIGGVGMMMNVKTGEIVAMVSVPDFNPNNPGDSRGGGGEDPRFNRAALGVYEMGSTFKSLTVAATMDAGRAKLTDTFDARAPLRVGRFTIDDFKPERKIMTLPEVFIYSSNIGTVKIVQQLGTEKFRAFLQSVGMTTPVKMEIPEIGKPIVPNPWGEISTMTIAFGHGLAVSAAQLLRAEAALVNGGILVTPTLIKKEHYGEPEGARVISRQTSDTMRHLLRLNVLAGTGGKAAVPGYVIGGKTGTTEKATGGGYSKSKLISSFIGAFPMDDPEYVVLVMIDEPKPIKESYGYATGGWVAAPAVAKIIQGAAPLLGVAPRDENAEELLEKTTIPGMNLAEFIAHHKGH